MDRLDDIFRSVARVVGDMAGALARRRVRRSAVIEWADALESTARDLRSTLM